MDTKMCRVCNAEKSLSDFPLRNGKPDTWCMACRSEYKKQYRAKNGDAISAKRKLSYLKNRDHYREQQREYYRRLDPQKVRDEGWANKLKSEYGITPGDYERMLVEQNEVCAICGRPETHKHNGRTIRLAVDHCHQTGTIRGLLCRACNVAIGLLGHDPERLRCATHYLEKFNT